MRAIESKNKEQRTHSRTHTIFMRAIFSNVCFFSWYILPTQCVDIIHIGMTTSWTHTLHVEKYIVNEWTKQSILCKISYLVHRLNCFIPFTLIGVRPVTAMLSHSISPPLCVYLLIFTFVNIRFYHLKRNWWHRRLWERKKMMNAGKNWLKIVFPNNNFATRSTEFMVKYA